MHTMSLYSPQSLSFVRYSSWHMGLQSGRLKENRYIFLYFNYTSGPVDAGKCQAFGASLLYIVAKCLIQVDL